MCDVQVQQCLEETPGHNLLLQTQLFKPVKTNTIRTATKERKTTQITGGNPEGSTKEKKISKLNIQHIQFGR